uniref:Solute carrier family 13 member 2 n=1 Tax=Hucho hucho TaxID=62062 RepID=A0A4W5LL07_9TELE
MPGHICRRLPGMDQAYQKILSYTTLWISGPAMVVCLRGLWRYRNYLIIFLTPLLILPLPLIVDGPEASCGFVIILMALYWCTECMPLAVTGLLPVILFPMMGIMESSEVCIQYMKDSNMLFVGGLLVAIAVEYWNLHKRIALRVLLIVGVRPALLMMGFMGTTAFLSMWISNTASTAMMLPIANAVLKQLCDTEAHAEEREMDLMAIRGAGTGTGVPKGQENQAFEMGDKENSITIDDEGAAKYTKDVKPRENGVKLEPEPEVEESLEARERRLKREAKYLNLDKGMSLSVCYAASIGGTATLTGTTPNLILKGQVDELFPGNGDIINFASWFGFSFPNMVLMLIISWLWLLFMYLGCNMKKSFGCGMNKDGDKEAYGVMKNEYKKLGSMCFAEGCVLVLFVLLILLWFTREPGFMPGWATVLFNKDRPYVTDGTVAILMSTLFFVIPSQLPRCGGYSEDGKPLKAPPTLLNWDVVQEKMPWNILLLLGGGFALARGSEVSGLSQWLGESLAPLQSIPPFAISFLLCLLTATFTECSSNVATTTLFLPILASMAVAIKLHPLYVMLPCTICASLAFMLPVATPPNAIAFSYGNLKVMDMAKAGFVLNIVGVITINIALNTWGAAIFNLNTFPDWANVTTIHTP